MNELYSSQAYIDYATAQTQAYIDSFMSTYGGSEDITDDSAEDVDITVESSSLESLKSIAVGFGTDESALQTCIDE